jgi:hypothetical protein
MKELGLEDVWKRDSVVGVEGWNVRVVVAVAAREERERVETEDEEETNAEELRENETRTAI